MFGGNFPGFFFGGRGGDDSEGMSHESESKAKAKKPVDNETFYKILGVSKNATPEEIRSSFKKQTVRGDYRHPDRGGDAKMFTQLREAFEVLSDPERRKIYDQGGEEALKEHAQGGGHGGDPFGDIFGMFGGHRPGRQQKQGMQKLKGRRVELQVELEDVYNGKLEILPVKRQRICLNCNGKGGDNVKKCGTCGGQGKVVRTMRMGPMIQQTIGECPDCNGEGESVDKKDQCKECKGKKVYEDNAKVEVAIDRGVPHEYDYVLTGEADELPGYMSGDLHVRIMIKKHKVFSRKGADLFIEQKITLLEALTGFSFEITHLDGAKFTVSTLPGEVIEHNAVKTVRGKGMPFWKDTISHGNLYVKFQVDFPKKGSLTKDHIAQLAKILPGPAPKELDKKSNFEYMDDFSQEDVNTNPEGGHGKAGEDDDEEGEGGHGQRVQCQHQ